jgi:hypothetical protein
MIVFEINLENIIAIATHILIAGLAPFFKTLLNPTFHALGVLNPVN